MHLIEIKSTWEEPTFFKTTQAIDIFQNYGTQYSANP
jgi:hypothetical protein